MERYLPLLRELVELSERRVDGYGARVAFSEGGVELHISVSIHLHLKHFSLPKRRGYGLIAGLDLNSDRINMAVVDFDARIVAMRTAWFPEVALHGFPRGKARDIGLKKLKELLSYTRRIGVDYIVFENLFNVKRRGRVRSSTGNRKVTRFAKRQLLQYGLLMTLKLGLTPILISPKGTTHSREHEEVMKKRGLDKHMASAYIVAIRGLKLIKNNHEVFRDWK